MATRDKDMTELMDTIDSWDGWRVEHGPKAWRIYPPPPHRVMSAPHGPHNPWRSRKNLIAKLRRAGAPL